MGGLLGGGGGGVWVPKGYVGPPPKLLGGSDPPSSYAYALHSRNRPDQDDTGLV